MPVQKAEIDRLLARLRLDPGDNGGPSRMDMLREREEAVAIIESLVESLSSAEKACDKALACMVRWQSGKPYDASGPEAGIRDALYEVIRPGARAGTHKLHQLLDANREE